MSYSGVAPARMPNTWDGWQFKVERCGDPDYIKVQLYDDQGTAVTYEVIDIENIVNEQWLSYEVRKLANEIWDRVERVGNLDRWLQEKKWLNPS